MNAIAADGAYSDEQEFVEEAAGDFVEGDDVVVAGAVLLVSDVAVDDDGFERIDVADDFVAVQQD